MPTRKIEGEPRALETSGGWFCAWVSREQRPALPLSHPRDRALEHLRVTVLVIGSEWSERTLVTPCLWMGLSVRSAFHPVLLSFTHTALSGLDVP